MPEIFYQAVASNGQIRAYVKDFDIAKSYIEEYNCLFVAKLTISHKFKTYHLCRYEFFDSSHNPISPIYRGYTVLALERTGSAGDLVLKLTYKNPEGISKNMDFHCDISFNHPLDNYKRIRAEWNPIDGDDFQTVFTYFDSLITLGEEATSKIIELEREKTRIDADLRWEIHCLKDQLEKKNEFASYVQEIIVPEGCKAINAKAIDCKSLKRIYFPQTLERIYEYLVFESDALEAVYCLATTPPRIDKFLRCDKTVPLYVPQASVELYKADTNWGQAFSIIKGI